MLNSLAWYLFSLLLLSSPPVVSDSLWPHGLQHNQASLFPYRISRSLPKFMFIASVMLSSHLILWCSLLLLPSVFPSIRDFSSELSVHIRWPKIVELQLQQAVLPVNVQGLSSLRSAGLISLLSKGLSGVFSSITVWRHQFFDILPSLWSSSHYLRIIFDVQIACPLCCKLLYRRTPSPASSEHFFRATEMLSPGLGVLNIPTK